MRPHSFSPELYQQPRTQMKPRGRCFGANACKGQGACNSANNSCMGVNACKGQGFLEMRIAIKSKRPHSSQRKMGDPANGGSKIQPEQYF